MPHKHKRKRGTGPEEDGANFDLPPTANASPLPNHKPKAVVVADDSGENKRSNKRRKPNRSQQNGQNATRPVADDTPKQFARLMAFTNQGKKLRKGLDDGVQAPKAKTKKVSRKEGNNISEARKPGSAEKPSSTNEDLKPTVSDSHQEGQLKILPGERLADFALRVDQSLPLSSVPKHATKPPKMAGADIKEKTYLTKHNKRLAKMQSQWREDDKRLQEKREDEDADRMEQREEEGLLWADVVEARNSRKGRRKKAEGDIWKVLDKKKREAGAGLSAGTTAQAPPTLKPLKNIFKEGSMRGSKISA
jgi:hypothetical protein